MAALGAIVGGFGDHSVALLVADGPRVDQGLSLAWRRCLRDGCRRFGRGFLDSDRLAGSGGRRLFGRRLGYRFLGGGIGCGFLMSLVQERRTPMRVAYLAG